MSRPYTPSGERSSKGGERKRLARFGSLLLSLLCCVGAAEPAVGQIALPDQVLRRLDFFAGDLTGHPSLAASGSRLVIASIGSGGTPGVALGAAISMDRGVHWSEAPVLTNPFPDGTIGTPVAVSMGSDGAAWLALYNGPLLCAKAPAFPPFAWSVPTIAIPGSVSAFLGYDLHSVASDEVSGNAYLSTTDGRDNSEYSSTVLFTRSVDGGVIWDVPLQLSSPYSKGSSMVVGPDGVIHVAWADYSLGAAMVTRSVDHGSSFEPPVMAAPMLDDLLLRPLGWRQTISPSRRYPWFKLIASGAPNFPALTVDRSTGPSRGTLYMTWADHLDGVEGAATQTLVETQPNETPDTAQPLPLDCDLFGAVSSVHPPTDPTDYFSFDLNEGESVWLSGDAFGESIGASLFMRQADGSLERTGFFRLLRPLDIPSLGRPKPLLFTAPRTGRYVLEVPTVFNGTGYKLKLRRYTPLPGSVARDMRDIVLIRSTDGGQTWSPKVRVNHDGAGHDQSMPNVAVDERGAVYVAWYDRRDAAYGDSVNAYAAVSRDGGVTFGPDMRLSSRSSAWVGKEGLYFPILPGVLVGDRIAIAAGDSYGVVAWTDFRRWPEGSDIYAARIVDIPTSVEAVSDLSAEPGTDGVRLTWTVNDARALAGLRLHRAREGGVEIVLSDAARLPTREGRQEYLDTTAEPGQTFTYRLEVQAAASVQWLGPVTVQTPARIASLAWRAAWPNPFAGRTSVKLAVPRASAGLVRVFDVQGKEVRTLAEGLFQPGERTIEWDGRDASGGVVAAGLYFVSAQVGTERSRIRLARVP